MVGELHNHLPHSQCHLGSVSVGFPYCTCLNMKKREFCNLRQGNHTVGQYVDEFSKSAGYALDDVATDAAKQEKFIEGLNDEMSM